MKSGLKLRQRDVTVFALAALFSIAKCVCAKANQFSIRRYLDSMKKLSAIFALALLQLSVIAVSIGEAQEQDSFPYHLPKEKPDRKMSRAMERIYTDYSAPQPENNELFSQFKYTELKGFGYHDGDGTISRRDPSKIIFENGKYYVWYTKRHSPVPPVGMRRAAEATDVIPSADWDLAEIWYATSKDGFAWEEQGVAIKRPEKPLVGWRSVTTTDILKWKGKYYLYYPGFLEASGTRGDDCPVQYSEDGVNFSIASIT
jgi:hypothetical protein